MTFNLHETELHKELLHDLERKKLHLKHFLQLYSGKCVRCSKSKQRNVTVDMIGNGPITYAKESTSN